MAEDRDKEAPSLEPPSLFARTETKQARPVEEEVSVGGGPRRPNPHHDLRRGDRPGTGHSPGRSAHLASTCPTTGSSAGCRAHVVADPAAGTGTAGPRGRSPTGRPGAVVAGLPSVPSCRGSRGVVRRCPEVRGRRRAAARGSSCWSRCWSSWSPSVPACCVPHTCPTRAAPARSRWGSRRGHAAVPGGSALRLVDDHRHPDRLGLHLPALALGADVLLRPERRRRRPRAAAAGGTRRRWPAIRLWSAAGEIASETPHESAVYRVAATSSAIWMALRAAPLRRLSPVTNSARPRRSGTPWS